MSQPFLFFYFQHKSLAKLVSLARPKLITLLPQPSIQQTIHWKNMRAFKVMAILGQRLQPVEGKAKALGVP